jgi:hypothetical protein
VRDFASQGSAAAHHEGTPFTTYDKYLRKISINTINLTLLVHNLTQALTNDSKITHSRTTFHKTLLVIADHVRHVRVDERMQNVLKNREIAD